MSEEKLICYEKWKPGRDAKEIVCRCSMIIGEYKAQGFVLTLRQLYYQLVARGYIENTDKSYNRIKMIVVKGRRAGLLDWSGIEDRTRNLIKNVHEVSPASALHKLARSYRIDLWVGQKFRPEVWVEKEALIGVIADTCDELDVPYFACKGYGSESEMWRAAGRLNGYSDAGQRPIILHLGDHDPSGIDMTRDIGSRLGLFRTFDPKVSMKINRIALNRDQIDFFKPPPNPAKITDSRWKAYADEHGTQSWELDALRPTVIVELIRKQVGRYIDRDAFDQRLKIQTNGREALHAASVDLAGDEPDPFD